MRLMWAAPLMLVSAVTTARPAWNRVVQEWETYHLTESQRQWFKSVRPKAPGPACCDIADGHPTTADHREDGWYVPNPRHPQEWLRVPDTAMTTPGTNPVGVATVWFGSFDAADHPYIRCFAPE